MNTVSPRPNSRLFSGLHATFPPPVVTTNRVGPSIARCVSLSLGPSLTRTTENSDIGGSYNRLLAVLIAKRLGIHLPDT